MSDTEALVRRVIAAFPVEPRPRGSMNRAPSNKRMQRPSAAQACLARRLMPDQHGSDAQRLLTRDSGISYSKRDN